MDILQSIILGLLQGLTEFLPISSSAHLILLPKLLGWADQGLLYDIAAHFGSLLALLIYFRQDLQKMIGGWVNSFSNGQNTEANMVWSLIIATIPICLAGLFFHREADLLREPLIIAAATVLFGLLLWWADGSGKRQRRLDDFRLRDAIVIGLFQILAMIPGTSRSGITITAGLMLGLEREAASRFSFLLAIPTILLASGYELFNVSFYGIQVDWAALFTVTVVSFISAYAAIHYFLKLIERTGMLPYVIYRLILGGILFALFL